MKANYLFIAALIIVSTVASAAGKDEPRKTGMAIVPVKGSEVFKVIYKGETIGRVKLNIYNSNSEVILTQTMNGVEGFICPVNFKGLESGEYTIELIDATGKKAEKVSYLPKKNLKNVHVSRLLNQNGKFLLAVSNEGQSEINVNIFDANDNLVHTEKKQISGDFAQVYKLKDGSYTFEVSDVTGATKTIRF
jgi:hypothetical protein